MTFAARNHVRKVSEASDSSFLRMRVLPPDRRDAMFAIYAFCREVDDIADDPLELDENGVCSRNGERKLSISSLAVPPN